MNVLPLGNCQRSWGGFLYDGIKSASLIVTRIITVTGLIDLGSYVTTGVNGDRAWFNFWDRLNVCQLESPTSPALLYTLPNRFFAWLEGTTSSQCMEKAEFLKNYIGGNNCPLLNLFLFSFLILYINVFYEAIFGERSYQDGETTLDKKTENGRGIEPKEIGFTPIETEGQSSPSSSVATTNESRSPSETTPSSRDQEVAYFTQNRQNGKTPQAY